MEKYGMGKYSELLFKYIFNIIEIHQLNKDSFLNYMITDQETADFRVDLLKALQFINSQEKIKIVKLHNSKTVYYKITNERLIFEIGDFLLNLYGDNFKQMYSTNEIEAELQNERNSEWVNQWKKENGIKKGRNGAQFYTSIKDEQKYNPIKQEEEEISGIEVKKQIISDFRRSHAKQAEISLETINKLLVELSGRNTVKSRKPRKNEFMTLLAAELSDLIRINRFLVLETADDFDKIPIKFPDDYRFIYDCLDFWTLIPDLEESTSMPEDYMSTTMKQGKGYFPADYASKRKERMAKLKEQLADYF